jgi:hypothetical protein
MQFSEFRLVHVLLSVCDETGMIVMYCSEDNIKWEFQKYCVCCVLDWAGPYYYLLTCLMMMIMRMMIVVVRKNEECEV